MADLTPQQRADLQTKRMVLQLELTEAQQKEIEKLNQAREIDRAKNRLTEEERSALSQEQRFTHKNAQLDAQIAYEREVKKILSDEQFEKFKKMRRHKAREGKRKSWRKNG